MLTEEQTCKILQRLDENVKIGEICKEIGVSRPTVYAVKRRGNTSCTISEASSVSACSEGLVLEGENTVLDYFEEETQPLQQPSLPPCPPMPEAQAYEAQGQRREALLAKLNAYFRAFPCKLAALTEGLDPESFASSLPSKSIGELEELLGRVRYRTSSSGLSDAGHLAFQTAAQGVETVGCQFGLKLKGYAASLATNESARQCLTELSIEYLSEIAVTPQRRLLMICVMQAYTTHTRNSSEAVADSILDEKVDASKFT